MSLGSPCPRIAGRTDRNEIVRLGEHVVLITRSAGVVVHGRLRRKGFDGANVWRGKASVVAHRWMLWAVRTVLLWGVGDRRHRSGLPRLCFSRYLNASASPGSLN